MFPTSHKLPIFQPHMFSGMISKSPKHFLFILFFVIFFLTINFLTQSPLFNGNTTSGAILYHFSVELLQETAFLSLLRSLHFFHYPSEHYPDFCHTYFGLYPQVDLLLPFLKKTVPFLCTWTFCSLCTSFTSSYIAAVSPDSSLWVSVVPHSPSFPSYCGLPFTLLQS